MRRVAGLGLLLAAACGGEVFTGAAGGNTGEGGGVATSTATSAAGGAPSGPGSGGATTTTTHGPGSGGAGGAEEICAGFGDPCTECASTSCAATWCGCVDNPDCLGLFSCINGCMGDASCEQDCKTTHQDGISNALLVGGCAGTTCEASCNWGNPDFNPCQECAYQDCSPEMNACIAHPECGPLWQCLGACPHLDLTCQQGCYAAYPNGSAVLQDALMCINAECQRVCQ